MNTPDFRPAIRRALAHQSSADFLRLLKPRVCRHCTAVKRLAHVKRLVLAGGVVTANTIAQQLGLSSKTIHRDICALRRAGLRIRYNSERNTWVRDRRSSTMRSNPAIDNSTL